MNSLVALSLKGAFMHRAFACDNCTEQAFKKATRLSVSLGFSIIINPLRSGSYG